MKGFFWEIDEVVFAKNENYKGLDAVNELLEGVAARGHDIAVDIKVGFAGLPEGDDLEEVPTVSSEDLDVFAAGVPVGVVSEAAPSGFWAVELDETIGAGEDCRGLHAVLGAVAEFPCGSE